MFRLLALEFSNQILGSVKEGDMVFVPVHEREITSNPYTTVLIGQNGTGKSTILSYIAQIIADLRYVKLNGKRNPRSKLDFTYKIKYRIDETVYVVTQSPPTGTHFVGSWHYKVTIRHGDQVTQPNTFKSLALPDKVVTMSYLPIDRFSYDDDENGFYSYLGLRSTGNNSNPRRLLNNAVPFLLNRKSPDTDREMLADILRFMSVDPLHLTAFAEYRYKDYFFTGELTDREFDNLMNDWRTFSSRKDTPFSYNYYKTNIEKDQNLKSRIVAYLNQLSEIDRITLGERNEFTINIMATEINSAELKLVDHIRRLDLIGSLRLRFRIDSSTFVDDADLSSGEYHFFTTMISLASSIRQNSLVLIDEPEVSYHPNWQMRYVGYLKKLFTEYSSSHFILASHSNFIVSDLVPESSEVIGLTGHAPNIKATAIKHSTYGWSAEEVLHKVFNVKTTRNYYLEYDITQLVYLINRNSLEKETIGHILYRLKKFQFSSEDPINVIIAKAEKYLEDNAEHTN